MAAPDTRPFTGDADADVGEAEPPADEAPPPFDVEAPPVDDAVPPPDDAVPPPDDAVPPPDDVVPPEPVVVDEPAPLDGMLSDAPGSNPPRMPFNGEVKVEEERIDPTVDILNDLKILDLLFHFASRRPFVS